MSQKFRVLIAFIHIAFALYLFSFLFYLPVRHAGAWIPWLGQNKNFFLGTAYVLGISALVLVLVKSDLLVWILFLADSLISALAVAGADPVFLPFLLAPGLIAPLFKHFPYLLGLMIQVTVQFMIFIALLLNHLFHKPEFLQELPFLSFGAALVLVNSGSILTAYAINRTIKENRRGEGLLDLMRASHELGALNNYDKISELLTTTITTMFDVHSFGLYVVEEQEGEQMAVPRWIESSHPQVFLPFSLGLQDSIMAEALRSKKPQVVHDLRQQNDRLMAQLQTFRGALFHPILFEEEVLGLIFLISDSPGMYGADQISLLELLATQVAVTLKNISLYQKTATMAITDSLTNLYTHGYFQDQLMKLVVEHKYKEKPLGLMIIDVDHFKVINDTYGHPQGDYILRQLAALVKSLVRSEDIASRYGGDEFVLIMPGQDRVRSSALAERIRASVEEYSFVTRGKTVNITVSVGVSSFPERLTTKDLVEAADEALYESKKRGRNQIYYV